MSRTTAPVTALLVASHVLLSGFATAELPEIKLTCLDEQVLHGATFQSNNQKIVFNRKGIFLAYLKSRNAEYTANMWRLMWSRDGGATFDVLASDTGATNPPVLETDDADNLYLGRVDWKIGDAFVDRFTAADDYRTRTTTTLPKGAAGKYAMAWDATRRQVCFFSHNNRFFQVAENGKLISAVDLLKPGPNAVLQYPSLCLDERGDLTAAWTTVQVGDKPGTHVYWDIHAMKSLDGGTTWQTLAGTKLTPPLVSDDTGPADRLILDDEFEVTTWLAGMVVRHGKLHAIYQTQSKPARYTYLRRELATGREELRHGPEFRGETLSLNGLDGVLVSRRADPNAPLFAIVKDATKPRLAALRSDDQGATWHDHAVSLPVTAPYAIGGCREITPDGRVIGLFTDAIEPSNEPVGKSKLYFFRFQVEPPTR